MVSSAGRQSRLASSENHLARNWMKVVLIGHGGTIGTHIEHGQKFSFAHLGHLAIFGEKIGRLTNGSYHIIVLQGSRFIANKRHNAMISLIERRSKKCVHAHINNAKSFEAGTLDVLNLGNESSCARNEK